MVFSSWTENLTVSQMMLAMLLFKVNKISLLFQVKLIVVKSISIVTILVMLILNSGFPRWLSGQKTKKIPLVSVGATEDASLDGEDPLEEEMATHPSILAWKIPRTEKPG